MKNRILRGKEKKGGMACEKNESRLILAGRLFGQLKVRSLSKSSHFELGLEAEATTMRRHYAWELRCSDIRGKREG